jgi:arginine:agmatine antiporter
LPGHRKLGPVLATIVVAGNMIGSGIFVLPATVAAVGSVTIVGWLAATVGAVALALMYAKLARRQPMAGGPASYVFDAFGPFAGMQASLWYWTSCLIGNVAIAAAAAGYLAAFVGATPSPVEIAFLTVALLWLGTAVNMVSPRFAGLFNGPLLIAGLVPLLLVGTLGWFTFDAAQFQANWNVSEFSNLGAIKHSLVLVFWAYLGLESASVAAAVVEEPERNVAVATVAGVLLAALIYIVVSACIMGLAPASDLAKSSAPFALVAGKMLGPAAVPLVALAGMLKATGTLTGWLLMTAQCSRAAADHGLLPQIFARTRAGDTPVAGLITAGLVGTASAILTISPTLGQQFGLLSEAATLFSLLLYLASCAAAIKYRLPGGFVFTLIGGAFCVCAIAWSDEETLKATAACLVVLALFYLPAMRRKYLLPDLAVRTGKLEQLRERHDDPDAGRRRPDV